MIYKKKYSTTLYLHFVGQQKIYVCRKWKQLKSPGIFRTVWNNFGEIKAKIES